MNVDYRTVERRVVKPSTMELGGVGGPGRVGVSVGVGYDFFIYLGEAAVIKHHRT